MCSLVLLKKRPGETSARSNSTSNRLSLTGGFSALDI